jgi:hypothetical protein
MVVYFRPAVSFKYYATLLENIAVKGTPLPPPPQSHPHTLKKDLRPVVLARLSLKEYKKDTEF